MTGAGIMKAEGVEHESRNIDVTLSAHVSPVARCPRMRNRSRF